MPYTHDSTHASCTSSEENGAPSALLAATRMPVSLHPPSDFGARIGAIRREVGGGAVCKLESKQAANLKKNP
jgi:hypothetical protein